MNTLSLWIYFADVLSGAESFFGFIACVNIGIVVMLSVASLIYFSDRDYMPEINTDKLKRGFRLCTITFFITSLIVVAIPEQKTIYLIIGSELTGDISVTPEFEKARKILNNKLDELLKQETEK